jgi:DNA-binding SARP family transcriptional activator
MAHMKTLELFFLRGFEVRLAGIPVESFKSDKTRALLAYLAMEAGLPLRRESLAGLFWPLKSEQQARHSLCQALHTIKLLLQDESEWKPFELALPIVRFHLNDHCQVDAHEFDRLAQGCELHRSNPPPACQVCQGLLEEAVGLYRSEFLTGFTLPGCEAFEAWLILQREHFIQAMVQVSDRLVQGYRFRGNIEKALIYSKQVIALDPFNETGHRQVMRLLAGQGQRSEAIAVYSAYRSKLEAELGIAPDDETTELCKQILTQTSKVQDPPPGK